MALRVGFPKTVYIDTTTSQAIRAGLETPTKFPGGVRLAARFAVRTAHADTVGVLVPMSREIKSADPDLTFESQLAPNPLSKHGLEPDYFEPEELLLPDRELRTGIAKLEAMAGDREGSEALRELLMIENLPFVKTRRRLHKRNGLIFRNTEDATPELRSLADAFDAEQLDIVHVLDVCLRTKHHVQAVGPGSWFIGHDVRDSFYPATSEVRQFRAGNEPAHRRLNADWVSAELENYLMDGIRQMTVQDYRLFLRDLTGPLAHWVYRLIEPRTGRFRAQEVRRFKNCVKAVREMKETSAVAGLCLAIGGTIDNLISNDAGLARVWAATLGAVGGLVASMGIPALNRHLAPWVIPLESRSARFFTRVRFKAKAPTWCKLPE